MTGLCHCRARLNRAVTVQLVSRVTSHSDRGTVTGRAAGPPLRRGRLALSAESAASVDCSSQVPPAGGPY